MSQKKDKRPDLRQPPSPSRSLNVVEKEREQGPLSGVNKSAVTLLVHGYFQRLHHYCFAANIGSRLTFILNLFFFYPCIV